MSQLLTLLKIYPRAQRTVLTLKLIKKIFGKTFLKNVATKDFFFVASDVVPVLYNKACLCTGD